MHPLMAEALYRALTMIAAAIRKCYIEADKESPTTRSARNN